jgi:hypothetical protein
MLEIPFPVRNARALPFGAASCRPYRDAPHAYTRERGPVLARKSDRAPPPPHDFDTPRAESRLADALGRSGRVAQDENYAPIILTWKKSCGGGLPKVRSVS